MLKELLSLFTLTPRDGVMILVSAVLFYALTHLLSRYFFTPYMALAELRENSTRGALMRAEEMNAEAVLIQRDTEDKVLQSRRESMAIKAKLVAEAKADAAVILARAESESRDMVNAARKELANATAGFQSGNRAAVEALVDQIVLKVTHGQ